MPEVTCELYIMNYHSSTTCQFCQLGSLPEVSLRRIDDADWRSVTGWYYYPEPGLEGSLFKGAEGIPIALALILRRIAGAEEIVIQLVFCAEDIDLPYRCRGNAPEMAHVNIVITLGLIWSENTHTSLFPAPVKIASGYQSAVRAAVTGLSYTQRR